MAQPKTPDLDPARVRELFDYRDGGLYWRERPARNCRAGGRAGSFCTGRYRQIRVLGVAYREHRIVWAWCHGVWPAGEIDHVNGIRDDNRVANLRPASATLNMENRRAAQQNNHSTGMLGVNIRTGRTRSTAQIKVGRKSYHLGTFDTPEEAHAAYLEAKRLMHKGNTL